MVRLSIGEGGHAERLVRALEAGLAAGGEEGPGQPAGRVGDIIKVMASGGAMTAGTDVLACQYTLGQLRTVVEEAHASGLAATVERLQRLLKVLLVP